MNVVKVNYPNVQSGETRIKGGDIFILGSHPFIVCNSFTSSNNDKYLWSLLDGVVYDFVPLPKYVSEFIKEYNEYWDDQNDTAKYLGQSSLTIEQIGE